MSFVHHFVDFVEGEGQADEDCYKATDGQSWLTLHIFVNDSLLKLPHSFLDRIQLQAKNKRQN